MPRHCYDARRRRYVSGSKRQHGAAGDGRKIRCAVLSGNVQQLALIAGCCAQVGWLGPTQELPCRLTATIVSGLFDRASGVVLGKPAPECNVIAVHDVGGGKIVGCIGSN